MPAHGLTARRALPGWAVDLMTEGLRGDTLTRADIVKAIRRIMLSAHRAGWTWPDVDTLLTDTTRHRLATQIATGRGGRTINAPTRDRFLREHWDDTARLAKRPCWDRADAVNFIEVVQEALDAADLPDADRRLMQVVLDLANQHGTSRPAVPARVVAEQTGVSKSAASRHLARLAATGEWIVLAQRGNRHRANLYALAPALAETYRGASPPVSHPVPTSHVPTSHPEEAPMHGVITTEMTPDEHAAVLRLLADMRATPRAEAEVRHLHAVAGEEASR